MMTKMFGAVMGKGAYFGSPLFRSNSQENVPMRQLHYFESERLEIGADFGNLVGAVIFADDGLHASEPGLVRTKQLFLRALNVDLQQIGSIPPEPLEDRRDAESFHCDRSSSAVIGGGQSMSHPAAEEETYWSIRDRCSRLKDRHGKIVELDIRCQRGEVVGMRFHSGNTSLREACRERNRRVAAVAAQIENGLRLAEVMIVIAKEKNLPEGGVVLRRHPHRESPLGMVMSDPDLEIGLPFDRRVVVPALDRQRLDGLQTMRLQPWRCRASFDVPGECAQIHSDSYGW